MGGRWGACSLAFKVFCLGSARWFVGLSVLAFLRSWLLRSVLHHHLSVFFSSFLLLVLGQQEQHKRNIEFYREIRSCTSLRVKRGSFRISALASWHTITIYHHRIGVTYWTWISWANEHHFKVLFLRFYLFSPFSSDFHCTDSSVQIERYNFTLNLQCLFLFSPPTLFSQSIKYKIIVTSSFIEYIVKSWQFSEQRRRRSVVSEEREGGQ